MLSGEVSDAASLDKAVTIARQFGLEIINSVSVESPTIFLSLYSSSHPGEGRSCRTLLERGWCGARGRGS